MMKGSKGALENKEVGEVLGQHGLPILGKGTVATFYERMATSQPW